MNKNQRTVTLPTIPKEVADLITNLRADPPVSNARILRIATDPTAIESYRDILRSIPFDTLMSALINGYVIEQSEEERRELAVKREWLDRDRRRIGSEYCNGFADGIEFVLGEFSIEIEGVNA